MAYHNFSDDISTEIFQFDVLSLQRLLNEPKQKEAEKLKIISHLCALLNSGGGRIRVRFHETPKSESVDKFIRMIEQQVLDLMGQNEMKRSFKLKDLTDSIEISVKATGRLFTMKYNLFWPTNRQVKQVCSSILAKSICTGRQPVMRQPSTACQRFVKGTTLLFRESEIAQFKQLKADPSKNVTLADRLTNKNNKLKATICAFANHDGGNIYIGISDDGVVQGEEMTKKHQAEIVNKVSKMITEKMIWRQVGVPKRTVQWDIFFEAVESAKSADTYVIVIHVAPCTGGVFIDEPESYHVVEGQVEKMSFSIWLAKLTQESLPSPSVPLAIPLVSWSSPKNRISFAKWTVELTRFTNEGGMAGFSTCMRRLAFYKSTDLILLAEKIAMACQQRRLRKAATLQQKFATLLKTTNCKDPLIYEIRNLHLESMIELANGNYKESYVKAQDGVRQMQLIAPGFCTVWLYIHAAMVTAVLSNNEKDPEKSRNLKQEARRYLELAERDTSGLQDCLEESSDIHQKLHICKAFVALDCAVTGELAQQQHRETSSTVQTATQELTLVYGTALIGKPLTPYRRVQCLFAQSDLLHQRAKIEGWNTTENARRAFELVTEALTLAKKFDFQDMIQYASKREANVTETLVRNALSSKKDKHSTDPFDN